MCGLVYKKYVQNIFIGQIWSKRLKLSFQTDIRHLDYFKYAEFNGDAYFLSSTKNTFLGKFGRKNQYYQSRLKFGT